MTYEQIVTKWNELYSLDEAATKVLDNAKNDKRIALENFQSIDALLRTHHEAEGI